MTTNEVPANAIAVIGMAGRFPGARTLSAYWNNLRNGVESIVTLSEDELRANGVSDKALANHNYVRRAALLDGIDEFDASFFGFTPLAARTLDPQHRLFLQTAWHALEDAGYQPGKIDGSVGVYGTSTTSGYLLHNLMSHYDPNVILGQGVSFEMVNLSLQNDKDYLATRVAHQLDLHGPALSVQTACSSALVALHLACQSILNGECEMALAGGSSLRVPHHVGYWHEPGSMVSGTGHCRPFDVRADGTIFSSGVGVVVLKALPDAVDDGDPIHAVIRGSALNNDGGTKMTYAAPTAAGQADVIAEAHAVAEVDASTISYVESHGTATPLGDPIEIEGLRQAFAVSEEQRQGPCYVGSVKSNIGHLESAAGIASLIKTILCLKHRAIPGTLHYTSPNPELHLDNGPFQIRGEYGPWEWDGIRRAGVSSFGVGGTNAHVILEEWPQQEAVGAAPKPGPEVLLLSARTSEALAQGRKDLAVELGSALTDADAPNLPDVAYTLAGRHPENLRLAAVVAGRADAVTVLGAEDSENVFIGEGLSDVTETDRVVFLFPGQGAQHIGMARGLYDNEPVFAEYFDRCAAGFEAELGYDLRAMIFEGTSRDLERTDRTQPALFTVEYALAKLVESYGVRPSALVGHSIGEYAAATVAGVFDLDTAIKVVAMRARLMHAAPRGVMVAVPVSADAVGAYLTADVDLAAVNDPDGCVVAGAEADIREFTEALKQAGINARRVRTSHAFHSRLMESMISEFTAFLSRQALHEPQIPLLSNLTGTWMAPSEATNPATWARSVRATVRFADEIDTVLGDGHRVLVEVGPGATLTASASRNPKFADGHRAVRLMRHHAQNRDDRDTFLLALGQLWAAGIEVDWSPLRGDYQPKRVTVPGYPFEHQRHWLEHNAGATWVSGAAGTAGAAGGQAGADGAASAGPSMESSLQRIWAVCLGVGSVDRNANFFDIGGDSLVAISVAMAASHEGLDITPQDLYDNPTVSALAKALTARYAAGGLGRQSLGEIVHPPVPPNITYFLENGVREHGRWRIPLVLRLRNDVSVDDVSAVLAAVVNHHDALRLRITERAGTWEQQILEPGEFGEITTHSLPEGLTAEHDAVRELLTEHIREQDLSSPPLTALYIRGSAGDVCYLALSLHAAVGDEASRDILVTDIFTAFGQKLAGNDIELAPAGVGWVEWSQRCAGLATHPAVLESRESWLKTVRSATLRLGAEVAEPPAAADLAKHTSTLGAADTSEIDDARRRLRLPVEEILLAGLTRAVASTVGEGTVAVDLAGAGRSVLKPEVDLGRTVGCFTTIYPVALACATDGGARQLLDSVHETLGAVPHYGIGYGLLRYLYAPTARLFGAVPPADVHFSYLGAIPELPSLGDAPVQFDPDTAMPVREAIPGLGHALELRVYRTAGVLHLDWWYDSRRIEESVLRTIAESFSVVVMELVRAAIAQEELAAEGQEGRAEAGEGADDEMALVDLS